MATTGEKELTCSLCYKLSNGKCVPITSTKYCSDLNGGVGRGAITTIDFARLAATWISNNNPSGVVAVLVSNGIVANMTIASAMSSTQLADTLYQYYTSNGKVAYGTLLSQIPVNDNISSSEAQTLVDATNDITVVANSNMIATNTLKPTEGIFSTQRTGDTVAKKWWETLIDVVVGSSNTNIDPVITTTTKTSPLTIGLIIAGIVIIGIVAWVVVKSR